MADDGSGEKTEEPTQKKLRDARKRGQVAKSKDVVSTALVISLCTYCSSSWRDSFEKLQQLIVLAPDYYQSEFIGAKNEIMAAAAGTAVSICMPYIFIAIAVAIISNFMQIGPVFSPDAIKPDLKKLDILEALKKMFSVKSLVEFAKSTIKVVVIGIVMYYVIRNNIDPLIKIPMMGIRGIVELLGPLMQYMMLYVFAVYIALAAFDYFFQQKQFTKEQRMTKDEVKREYKESEGSPEIKGKRKQLHQELIQESAGQQTKKSSVLITNPTHYAVAVLYNPAKYGLPMVMAKGEGYLALFMMRAAKEAGVPIMQNVTLARALFNEVPIEKFIPTDLMQAVAQVLIEVNKLKQEGII